MSAPFWAVGVLMFLKFYDQYQLINAIVDQRNNFMSDSTDGNI